MMNEIQQSYPKHSYGRRSDEESGEGSVENGGEAMSRPLSSSSCASESSPTRLEAPQSATAPRAPWVPDPVDALPWIWTPTTYAWSTGWTNRPAPSPRGGSQPCASVVRVGGKALPSPSSSFASKWPLPSSSSAICCETKNGSPSTWPSWPGRRRRSPWSRRSRRRRSPRSRRSRRRRCARSAAPSRILRGWKRGVDVEDEKSKVAAARRMRRLGDGRGCNGDGRGEGARRRLCIGREGRRFCIGGEGRRFCIGREGPTLSYIS